MRTESDDAVTQPVLRVDDFDAWLHYLKHSPEVQIPGIRRCKYDTLEHIDSPNALRGALRIAALGPNDEHGIATIAFLRQVAEYIRKRPIIAEQFLDATPYNVRTHHSLGNWLDMVRQREVQGTPSWTEDEVETTSHIRRWIEAVNPPVSLSSSEDFPPLGHASPGPHM